jgi:hypothetical protein
MCNYGDWAAHDLSRRPPLLLPGPAEIFKGEVLDIHWLFPVLNISLVVGLTDSYLVSK